MFGSDLEHRVWSRFWNWNLANILRLVLTWDLTIFGNTIGNKDRGEVIARTWFHSFFSRKKSEIWIAFTFFEKWKVKNKIPSLFFEKWKWNWNGSRSRTRSENEKKFSRILEKRESRWCLSSGRFNISMETHFPSSQCRMTEVKRFDIKFSRTLQYRADSRIPSVSNQYFRFNSYVFKR